MDQVASTRPEIALLYPFLHRRGGVERYVVELASRTKNTYDTLVACHEWDAQSASGLSLLRIAMLKWPAFLQSFSFAVACLWNPRLKDNVLIHSQGANSFRQHVITAHSVHKAWFRQSLSMLPRFSRGKILKILNPLHLLTILTETIQYRKGGYGRIIAISKVVRDELVNHYKVDPEKIKVIYNGVDLPQFAGRNEIEREAARLSLGFQKNDIVSLFVSNEFRRKGLAEFIEAISRIPEEQVKLFVVGKDNPAPYKAMAGNKGILNRVVFAGPAADVKKCYDAADIFVLPTLYEPFGLVVTEAMASGLPVVVSKLAGAAELVTNEKDGLLLNNPSDATELARLIRRLMDGKERQRIGRNARTTAEQFTWDRVARETFAVYEDVLSQMRQERS